MSHRALPFLVERGSLDAGRHTLEIKDLNTSATAGRDDPDKVRLLLSGRDWRKEN